MAMVPAFAGTDRDAQARCFESFDALRAGCRDGVAALPPERRFHELARLVCAYALSAREARVRPELVLANLRTALEPVGLSGDVPIDLLVQRATLEYYGMPH